MNKKEKQSRIMALEIKSVEDSKLKAKQMMIKSKSEYFALCKKYEQLRKDFINFWVQ